MKKQVFILLLSITALLGSCKKDDNSSGGGGAAITDASTAKAAFLKINSLWTGILKPTIAKTEKTYAGDVFTGSAGGQATVNGTYRTTNSGSSSSSTTSSTMDMVITFKNYSVDGLTLNGTILFYDYSESRSACSSSGCAFASHTSVSYLSEDGSGNAEPAASIQFDNGGTKVSDQILIHASKSDAAHWAVKVTNGSGQLFSFSY